MEAARDETGVVIAGVAYRLWQYDGTTARRLYPPAQDQVKQAIASIAAQVFRQDVWEPAARSLAQQLGPPQARIGSLE